MKIRWQCKAFTDLSAVEIYGLLALREEVFVVEQKCIYKDIDGHDLDCDHLLGIESISGDLIAYSRIVPPGSDEEIFHLGRILVKKAYRSQGLGVSLVEKSIEICQFKYPQHKILISAQSHLESFYIKFGFVTISEIYDDEGIDHIDMIR
ncbi:MAG: GNAT family N-acetyltransferase [Desulfotalea sp.]